MSKDLTQKLNGSLEDKIDWLVSAVQSMGSRLGNIETRLVSVETRLDSVETRLGNLEMRLDSVDSRLGNLETKVDERLKDTRPMWEAVQAQLSDIKESQDHLRDEMEKGFRRLDRNFDHLSGDVNRLHGDHRGLEERVDKIERRLSQ